MSSNKKKIYFGFGIPSGGVPSFARQLAGALRGMREVEVYGPSSGYQPVGKFGLNEWKFSLLSLFVLGFRKFTGALVHLHSRSLLIPDVFTVHGMYTKDWLGDPRTSFFSRLQFRLMSFVELRLIRRARKVVFVSGRNQKFAESLIGFTRPEAFSIILPGVNAQKFSPELRLRKTVERARFFSELNPNCRWLLFVGASFKRKGLFRILSALQEHTGGAWHVLVMGNDPAEIERARKEASTLGGRVVFFENDRLLSEAYALSDILVMDSTSEGFPLVLLEAMAAGAVPFVTKFDGTDEAIEEGKTGFLFDNAEALVEKALKVDGAHLREMLPAMRSFAEKHTWALTAEKYEALYKIL